MSAQTTQAQTLSDERSIRELVDKWLAASKKGDITTLHSLMADDVIFMTPGREPFGKEAFTASNEQPTLKEATSNIQEIKVLGNSAWMRNYLDLVISFPNAESKRLAGYTLTILEKNRDGQWVISRDANLVMPKDTD
jgi:uncharacterized protein (TIGR02246 family)